MIGSQHAESESLPRVLRPKHANDIMEPINVVKALFPQAMTLFDFFSQYALIDSSSSEPIITPADSWRYRDTILTSYIVPSQDLLSHMSYDKPTAASWTDEVREAHPIRETICRFIAQVIHQANSKVFAQNCLALGYRSKTLGGDMTMRSHMDIECVFVNTLHAIISTQVWQLLAARIGEEWLMRTLSQPVFLKANNSCYIQVQHRSPMSSSLYQQAYLCIPPLTYIIFSYTSKCR
jgi:hypothetical protein